MVELILVDYLNKSQQRGTILMAQFRYKLNFINVIIGICITVAIGTTILQFVDII